MSRAGRILGVDPAAAIPGGEVAIDCTDFDTSDLSTCHALFAGARAHLVAASNRRLLALVPEMAASGETEVTVESAGERSASSRCLIAKKLAEDLHPVANPAFDPDDGSLYVTRSGSRGQHFPVTIFRIDANGEVSDFSGDVTNPTGIAFDKSGQMFVTSRLDGTVYRVSPFNEPVSFAEDLGIATGLAFDQEGWLYVGDRTGTIYRVNSIGEAEPFVLLEPSVSAYHLAFGPDDALYMTGPTVSSHDAVIRVDKRGRKSDFYRGLGRPQGLAFD
ncbi:MAG: hypothetical protein AUG51_13525, partial [Acidobacteria bacterium 13_1_20CM_3_53_8]